MCSTIPSVLQPVLLVMLLVAGQVAPLAPVRAVWADQETLMVRPGAAPAAVWADEMEPEIELSETSQKIERDHNSTPVIEKNPIDRKFDIADRDGENLRNETRQIEAIAFPIGIAIGAIGAAILPTLFPGQTTTTQASVAVSGDLNSEDSEVVIISADPTTTARPATTTPFVQRSVLKDFDNCGVKGSSNRVIGGAEVVENEYPWLCSLKYRGNHICGMTLLSGPPHDTILVGAAHCFSQGDDPSRYTITCGEHSLQKQDSYQVTLQVQQVIVHPRYEEASTSGFDIAVYKVNDVPLRNKMLEKKLWPVCLPSIENEFFGDTTYVAGWGITRTKYVRGSKIQVKGIPDIARHASVFITPCRDPDNFAYPKGLLCAAAQGRDSCQGDSGGPLVGISSKYSDSVNKRYAWLGIVSFGVGCAEEGYPGAYTRTQCFLGFVAEQFGLKADFTPPGTHPSWSTDCPSGASRRASGVSLYKNLNKNKNKKKTRKNEKKKNKNRNRKKTHSREGNSTFIDKSELITIDSLDRTENVETEDIETPVSRDSGHKTISREDDESDEPNPGKPDLLSLLRDIVSPFL